MIRESLGNLWNEFVKLPLYHGTNSLFLPDISVNGLDPSRRPWDEVDFQRLNDILKEGGWEFGIGVYYNNGQDYIGKIHLTYRRDTAELYSESAPEIGLELESSIFSLNHNGSLSSDKISEANEIYEKYKQRFSGGSPIVLCINPEAPPILESFVGAYKSLEEPQVDFRLYVQDLIEGIMEGFNYTASVTEQIVQFCKIQTY